MNETVDEHNCHLCKTPFEKGPAYNRIVSLINEQGRQLKQSNILQQNRIERLKSLQLKFEATHREWTNASRELSDLQILPSGDLRAKLRSLNREIGYVDRQIEGLAEKISIAEDIERLSERKSNLNADISRLRFRNDFLKSSQAKRLGQAFALIEQEVISLLHGDLRRQDAFVAAKHVKFDFGGNSIGVDSQSYFSASSRVILKSSFFVGFLFAATKDRLFRHPRFCLIDTVEDKGMEQVRSHNFQRMIVSRSTRATAEHQIIFATAMIAPELDTDQFTVGSHSTLESGSINLMRPGSTSLI